MSNAPTQTTIERTAWIVAAANGDDNCGAKDPDRYWAWCAASSEEYLSDHRTVARYLAHVLILTHIDTFSLPPSVREEYAVTQASIVEFMHDAWATPMPAIIALVAAVGEGE